MKMEDVEQMNYAMAIVGHGRYPEGVLSALKLLIGTTEGMTAFNLESLRKISQINISFQVRL